MTLKKALMYKEWQSIKWIAVLIFMNTLIFETIFATDKVYIFASLIILFLAYMLMKDERNEASYKNLTSMPFTRCEIIFNKLIIGLIAIVLPELINFVLILISYFWAKADSSFNNFSYGISIYICMFCFFMLLQSITANSIFGAVIGGILLFDMSGFSPVSFIYINSKFLYSSFKLNIFNLPDKKIMSIALFRYSYVNSVNYLVPFVFILLTLLFSTAAILTFKKNKFENVGNMTMFKWAEVLLKVYGAIYFSAFLVVVFGDVIRKYNFILIDILFIVFFVFWYIVFSKAFESNTYSKVDVKKRLRL